jgi:hypothetical protein
VLLYFRSKKGAEPKMSDFENLAPQNRGIEVPKFSKMLSSSSRSHIHLKDVGGAFSSFASRSL